MGVVRLRGSDGRVREVQIPSDVKPYKFRNFVETVLRVYRPGDDITIKDAAEITRVCEEIASKYLELMRKFQFLHIKGPEWQPAKIYRIGCTPAEEFEHAQESRESVAGLAAFKLFKRLAGLFHRPACILSSQELSREEKLSLLRKWLEEHWFEVILGPALFPVAFVGGTIIANEANKSQRLGEHENSAPQEAQPSIRFNIA